MKLRKRFLRLLANRAEQISKTFHRESQSSEMFVGGVWMDGWVDGWTDGQTDEIVFGVIH